MDRKTEFVGSVGIKPAFHELVRKCAGALAAVSSGIVLFATQGERPVGLAANLMLSMHAFSVPCLIAGSIFFGLFGAYERVSLRTQALLDRLFYAGFVFSSAGYFLLVWGFSRWLYLALLAGIVFTIYQVMEMAKEAGGPHMKRIE
jgi:hypothetical protein